jgi:hypothetical protein
VPLQADKLEHVRAAQPLLVPIPAGATVVAVVTMVRGEPQGPFATLTFDGPDTAPRELFGGHQVQSSLHPVGWDNVAAVALGTGRDKQGAELPVSASLAAFSVPAGATHYTVATEGRRDLLVLGTGGWANAPFPFEADHVVPDTTWVPFVVPEDGTLSLPRPAALPPIAPVTGFLHSDGERIVDDQGQVVHFYGTNLTIGWDLPTKEGAEALAGTLSTLGFNLVRVSILPVSRATLYSGGQARTPTPDEWARFDGLVDALARHGIRL